MGTPEAVTLAIAVLGATLGVINTWRGFDQTRVKLKVTPAHAFSSAPAPLVDFSITVTNLGAIPVTIEEVGVYYAGTSQRCVYTEPVLIDGGAWPRRLEPRSSVSVFGPRPEVLQGHRIKSAYAVTQCGVTQRGTSPALRQIAAQN